MKKILILNTVGMRYEGISSVIMNYLENMDRTGLDIYVLVYENTDKQLLNRISKVAKTVTIPDRKYDFKNYLKEMPDVLRSGYDVFHIHGNSGTMFADVLLAKMYGVKKVITHVHNTTCDHALANKLLKRPMIKLTDKRLACSINSGKWLYGNRDFIVLNNAIDLKKYAFDLEVRKQIRNEMGIEDEYVVGYSGSFNEQKNHTFLIDIFFEFLKLTPNSKLILLSDGPRLNQIKEKVNSMGIENEVLFLGRKADAYLYYNAMDCFVMPSKREGLPLVALEAQASELPVYISDNVTKEVGCTSMIKFLSLENEARQWAEEIYKGMSLAIEREEGINREMEKGIFDIKSEASKLKKIYTGEC